MARGVHRWQWLVGFGVAIGASATVVGSAWMQDASPRANDGLTFEQQSADTQTLFRATWGPEAAQRWVAEHNASLARLTPTAAPPTAAPSATSTPKAPTATPEPKESPTPTETATPETSPTVVGFPTYTPPPTATMGSAPTAGLIATAITIHP